MIKFRLPFTTDMREMVSVESFEDAVRDVYDDILQEQFSNADRLLSLEDAEWIRLGNVKGRVMEEKTRIDTVKLSRIFAIRNSITRQSIQLYTNFSIGTGLSITTEDKRVRKVINDFWTDRSNRRFTRTQGQRKLSDMFLQDGELFLALFSEIGKIPVIRPLDSLEITDIATDANDRFTNRFYKRSRVLRNNKPEVTWLQDFENHSPRRPGISSEGDRINTATRTNLPLVYYSQLQGCDKRGYPLVTAQIQWARAHKVFMNSRIAVQQALARTAKQYRVKGGMKQVSAIKAALQSSLVSGSTETNPAPTYGSSEVMNKAMDVRTVRQETGAKAAEIDGNMILTMAGAAVGIFPHYFGAGEAFRLATATAMEAPMLKTFQAYRQLWKDMWKDVFDYVLLVDGIESSEELYELEYPDIFPENIQSVVQATDFAVQSFPEFSQIDALKKLTLSRLGVRNVDKLLEGLVAVKNDDNEDDDVREAGKKLHEILKAMSNGH